MRVLLSGYFNDVTGFGVDGIGLARALLRRGFDVYLDPLNVFPPLPREVAALLAKPLPGEVDLAISYRRPAELADRTTAGATVPAYLTVAWTMYEWTSLANLDYPDIFATDRPLTDLGEPVRSGTVERLAANMAIFDALITTDQVSHRALGHLHPNTFVLQGGYEPELWPPMGRDWSASPFRFVMVGALSNRKNPFAVIRAFKALRDAGELADATLTLKSTQPGITPRVGEWAPGVEVVLAGWSMSKLREFYGSCHALLAPSRGEGKNLPAVEFASTGGAVAVTDVGGHAQWASTEYTWTLPFEWSPVPGYPDCQEAEVDGGALADAMLEMYRDRGEARRRGEIASKVLPAMCGWDSVVERLLTELSRRCGRRGREIADLAAMIRRPERDSSRDAMAATAALEW